jgi:hypothetical protein
MALTTDRLRVTVCAAIGPDANAYIDALLDRRTMSR